jgi:hypothetical protein
VRTVTAWVIVFLVAFYHDEIKRVVAALESIAESLKGKTDE